MEFIEFSAEIPRFHFSSADRFPRAFNKFLGHFLSLWYIGRMDSIRHPDFALSKIPFTFSSGGGGGQIGGETHGGGLIVITEADSDHYQLHPHSPPIQIHY